MDDEERKRIAFEVRNPQAAAYSKIIDEKNVEIERLKALADIVPDMGAIMEANESIINRFCQNHPLVAFALKGEYISGEHILAKARELTEAK